MAMEMSREEILEKVASATSIIDANKKEYEYDIDVNGYKGHFRVKHPSLMDQMNIGIVTSRLLKGVPGEQVNVIANNIAFMTATLSVVCIEAPKWLSIEQLDDYKVLEAAYEEYRKWNDTFRKADNSVSNEGTSEDSKNERHMVDDEKVQSSNK